MNVRLTAYIIIYSPIWCSCTICFRLVSIIS